MRDFLIDVVNHRFVFTFSITLLAAAGILLPQDGIQATDIAIVFGIGAVGFAVWRILVSNNTEGIATVQSFQDAIRNGERASLVQFYSPYCPGCLAMKPVVDQLEADAGSRLQVIRLNIDDEPGRSLMSEFGVVFTPTFIQFDRNGNKVRDSVLILDRARILYDLERA